MTDQIFKNDIPVGRTLVISAGTIRLELQRVDETSFLIQGDPRYCPTPTPAMVIGSTFAGAAVARSLIGVGMRFLYGTPTFPQITTAQVQSLEVQ